MLFVGICCFVFMHSICVSLVCMFSFRGVFPRFAAFVVASVVFVVCCLCCVVLPGCSCLLLLMDVCLVRCVCCFVLSVFVAVCLLYCCLFVC